MYIAGSVNGMSIVMENSVLICIIFSFVTVLVEKGLFRSHWLHYEDPARISIIGRDGISWMEIKEDPWGHLKQTGVSAENPYGLQFNMDKDPTSLFFDIQFKRGLTFPDKNKELENMKRYHPALSCDTEKAKEDGYVCITDDKEKVRISMSRVCMHHLPYRHKKLTLKNLLHKWENKQCLCQMK